MKVLPGSEIARPTADVGQALRFREVCLFPLQFPRQISLQLPRSLALLLGLFSFGYVHCDTNVLAEFSRGIVMSY